MIRPRLPLEHAVMVHHGPLLGRPPLLDTPAPPVRHDTGGGLDVAIRSARSHAYRPRRARRLLRLVMLGVVLAIILAGIGLLATAMAMRWIGL